MTDRLDCRLRMHGDDLDLAGPPAALRALASTLREGGPALEVAIRNGLVVQERAEAPLSITLRGGPTLHLRGDDAGLARVWAALEAVAADTESTDDPAPHRHVDQLVVTGDRSDPLADLGL
jgi:hypothetical protein